MYSRIIQMHDELTARLAGKSFSSLSEDAQLKYCRQKLELGALAYAEYEKLKSNPEQALIAAELYFIATWTRSNKAVIARTSNSINLVSLAISFDKQAQPEVLFKKGICYLLGIAGYAQSNQTAYELFVLAAEGNYSGAAWFAGWMHDLKKIKSAQAQLAVFWYRKAAEKQGCALGQNSLGVVYYNGKGVEEDNEKAATWYRKAAEQGFATGQFNLGTMYEKGLGVEKNAKEATSWYRHAAEQGYPDAQSHLGYLYHHGTGIVNDDKEAVIWYQKAADQEYALAQYNLGVVYYNGKGVAKNEKEAASWFRKAANQEYAMAQNELGVLYSKGTGVERDAKEAVFWFRKAAEQKFDMAQSNLAAMYDTGTGVEKDEKEAASLYRKAAEQGYAIAQYNLGKMYKDGAGGLAKDDWSAARWWYYAAENNHVDAQQKLSPSHNGLTIFTTYYQALHTQDHQSFADLLCNHIKIVEVIRTDIEEPLIDNDKMSKRISIMIDQLNPKILPDHYHNLINTINIQQALAYNKRAIRMASPENKTVPELMRFFDKIDFSNTPQANIQPLIHLLIESWYAASNLYLSEESNRLVNYLVKLIHKCSASEEKLGTYMMSQCLAIITKDRLGSDYTADLNKTISNEKLCMLFLMLESRQYSSDEINNMLKVNVITKKIDLSKKPAVPLIISGIIPGIINASIFSQTNDSNHLPKRESDEPTQPNITQ